MSPDGTQVAVVVGSLLPNGYDAWSLDLTSGRRTQLTFDLASWDGFPTWTPDGDRVAFGMNVPLSWMAPDRSAPLELLLPDDGIARYPYAFSADGAILVYREDDDLFMLPLEGARTPTRLWKSPFLERNADLSPDGRWLTYESNENGRFEVWVRPFPNVEDGARVVSNGVGLWPLWNPSGGHELYYIGSQGMMAVTVETEPTFSSAPPVRLFETNVYGTPDIVGNNRRIDIAPDGERFLMFKFEEPAEILDGPDLILILNWIDELRRLVPTP